MQSFLKEDIEVFHDLLYSSCWQRSSEKYVKYVCNGPVKEDIGLLPNQVSQKGLQLIRETKIIANQNFQALLYTVVIDFQRYFVTFNGLIIIPYSIPRMTILQHAKVLAQPTMSNPQPAGGPV